MKRVLLGVFCGALLTPAHVAWAADDTLIFFGTHKDPKNQAVPARVVVCGPALLVKNVLKPEWYGNGVEKLKPGGPYMLKVRLGAGPNFAYFKAEGLTVPQVTTKGNGVKMVVNADGVDAVVDRSDAPVEITKKGNVITLQSNTRTIVDFRQTLTYQPSSADEFGYQRVWTSDDGKTITATYVMQDEAGVTLTLSNGKLTVIPLARLSAQDQAHIAAFSRKRSP